MFFLFPQKTKKLEWEKIMPYQSDLMYMVNPCLGLRLCNLVNADGKQFQIDFLMKQEQEVFHCENPDQRIKDFEQIMDARLERLFITKKSKYLFFDGEEQAYLKDAFDTLQLSCVVEPYLLGEDGMKKIELNELNPRYRVLIINAMRKLDVRYICELKEYFEWTQMDRNHSSTGFSRTKSDFFAEMEYKFPKLKEVKTKGEVKKYERYLSKKYHPDVSKFDPELYAQMRKDLDSLKESMWYKKLPDGGDN